MMSKDRRSFDLTEAQSAYEMMVNDFECMKEKCENALFNAEQAIKASDTSTEARWEINGNSAPCSVCGFDTGFAGTALEGQLKMYRFCPNCGHPIQSNKSAKDTEYSIDAGDGEIDITLPQSVADAVKKVRISTNKGDIAIYTKEN